MSGLFMSVMVLLWGAGCLSALRLVTTPLANGGTLTIAEDGAVTLTCWTESEDPVQPGQEVQWLRNGALIRLQEGNRDNGSSVCLQSVSRDDHSVTFRCQLKQNPSVNSSVQLAVLFPPDLSGSENVTVEEGSTVTFTCNIYANPQVSVLWWQDGRLLDLSEGHYSLTHDGRVSSLSISTARQQRHQGLFQCQATSAAFGERSKSFSLTVEEVKRKFPVGPIIAGAVVVFCTACLAFLSRWKRMVQCCKRDHCGND